MRFWTLGFCHKTILSRVLIHGLKPFHIYVFVFAEIFGIIVCKVMILGLNETKGSVFSFSVPKVSMRLQGRFLGSQWYHRIHHENFFKNIPLSQWDSGSKFSGFIKTAGLDPAVSMRLWDRTHGFTETTGSDPAVWMRLQDWIQQSQWDCENLLESNYWLSFS
jgi:hypothetical protein